MAGTASPVLPEAVRRVVSALQNHAHPHAPLMFDHPARTAQQAAEQLGVAVGQIGGVPPLAHQNPSLTLVDVSLLRFEEIWAAAGHPHAVFRLSAPQLLAMTGVAAQDLCEGPA